MKIKGLEQKLKKKTQNFESDRNELREAYNKENVEKSKYKKETILQNKTINELKNENKDLKKLKNKLQERLFELDRNVISLDSKFPTIQDIVVKFETLRSQTRSNVI